MDKNRCNEIQLMIKNDKKNEIIKILNELYHSFSINNKQNRTSLYISENVVDYIICNGILYRLNEDAQRYINSYILKKYFSKPPPIYCLK